MSGQKSPKHVGKGSIVTRGHNFKLKIFLYAAFFSIPLLSYQLYWVFGHPFMPSQSFNALLEKDVHKLNFSQSLVRLEVLYERSPNGQRAEELGLMYLRAGLGEEALLAYSDAIRFLGESSRRLVGCGLALMQINNGIINDEAQRAFEKAMSLSQDDIYPVIFLAKAYCQKQQRDKAYNLLQKFLQSHPHLSDKKRQKLIAIIKDYKSQLNVDKEW